MLLKILECYCQLDLVSWNYKFRKSLRKCLTFFRFEMRIPGRPSYGNSLFYLNFGFWLPIFLHLKTLPLALDFLDSFEPISAKNCLALWVHLIFTRHLYFLCPFRRSFKGTKKEQKASKYEMNPQRQAIFGRYWLKTI